ncbi:hypothetical protein PLANPX_2803 [Lacipirellula parvula]|uniref:Uncharacterized protein n=1 Tax=Lacipirellula parvula TaxID=2650471 RepID=A0A5K7XE97_9BACT|nr:hypothetical protein PLANPX_2803 [Lacipirellula parvula]
MDFSRPLNGPLAGALLATGIQFALGWQVFLQLAIFVVF